MQALKVVCAIIGLGSVLAGAALAAEAPLSGSGEWQSVKGDGIGGKWTVALTRSGGRVAGTLTLTGSNVFTGGTVSGTVDDKQVVLGVLSEAGKAATFTGALDGDTLKGEWEAALVDDHGVWVGTLGAPAPKDEPAAAQ